MGCCLNFVMNFWNIEKCPFTYWLNGRLFRFLHGVKWKVVSPDSRYRDSSGSVWVAPLFEYNFFPCESISNISSIPFFKFLIPRVWVSVDGGGGGGSNKIVYTFFSFSFHVYFVFSVGGGGVSKKQKASSGDRVVLSSSILTDGYHFACIAQQSYAFSTNLHANIDVDVHLIVRYHFAYSTQQKLCI